MDELQARIIGKLIDIAGQIISMKISQPDYSKYEKAVEKIYAEHIPVKEEKEEKEKLSEKKEEKIKIEKKSPLAEKIKGTACIPCSKNHISTVSASLNEAVRFARSEGINHPEVVRRIGIAMDELNIMERIDLAPDKLIGLNEKEKEIAEWVLKKSRELRHMIDEIKTPEDLEKTASEAAKIRTEFLSKIFDVSGLRDRKEELKREICEGLPEEDRKKCIEAIESI